MFSFYQVTADETGWEIQLLQDDEETVIKNDKGAIERLLSKINFLVGYDNYSKSDKLLASILKGLDPFDTLEKINSNKRVSFMLQSPITLDLKQELRNLDLEEVKYNLGAQDKSDVYVMQQIFKEREDYFTSKFEVVKEFKLQPPSLKKTRVGLASDILKTRKGTDKERLNITYDDRLQMKELPKPITDFYKSIQDQFKKGTDFTELEKEKFTFKLCDLDHLYGFGGLHAAKENYVSEGYFMQIDVKS